MAAGWKLYFLEDEYIATFLFRSTRISLAVLIMWLWIFQIQYEVTPLLPFYSWKKIRWSKTILHGTILSSCVHIMKELSRFHVEWLFLSAVWIRRQVEVDTVIVSVLLFVAPRSSLTLFSQWRRHPSYDRRWIWKIIFINL